MTDAPTPDTSRPAGRALTVLRYLVPILLLGAILWTTDWARLVECTRAANPWLLAGAFVLYQLAIFVQGLRWHDLLESDTTRWPFWRIQYVNYISMFFDGFTPGKLGSDTFRVAAFRSSGRIHYLVISLLALRLHAMAANIVLAAIVGGIVLSIKHGWLKVAVPELVAILLLAWLIPKAYQAIRKGTLHVKYKTTGLKQSIAVQISRAHDAVKAIYSNPRTLRRSSILVTLYMLIIVSVYYLTGLAFKMTLPFQNYLAVVPLLILASVIPISVQGRGLTEIVAIGCWQGLRASQEQILLTCLAVFAIMMIQGLVGGAVWAFSPKTPAPAEAAVPHPPPTPGAP